LENLFRFDDRITVLKFILPMRMAISPVLMIKCVIEARPVKMQPVVVTNHADSTEKAFTVL
jgi:hypothetical protein